MSEYPVNCCECGKYIGYVHATEYSKNHLCDECYQRLKREKGCGRLIPEIGEECGSIFEGHFVNCGQCVSHKGGEVGGKDE